MSNQLELEKYLDPQQIEAVKTVDGYVRVFAGAGSGKTRVLTYRYAYLVEEAGVSSDKIACITFTVRAADEMKSRIRKLIGEKIGTVCTFNSLGSQILREEMHHISWLDKFGTKGDDTLNMLNGFQTY